MTDFSRLNFGALAAERDDSLRDYFIESESFRRLISGEKSVIMGPRGSGKTALFRMVADRARANAQTVIELTPDEYSYELLAETMASEAKGAWAKHGAYSAAWKYLIYVLVMKKLVQTGGKFKKGPEAKIYEYLRDHHDGVDKNPIGTLISYMKRLEGLKIGSYEAGLKVRELQKLYRLEEIEPLLESLNEVAGREGVVVLVDELDRGWDASEDAIAFVSGLFQAAVGIGLRTPNVRVLVSLRRELYENIPALYEDAQKVRDVIETVEWDEPSLRSLIARRIAHSVPDLAQADSDTQLWTSVFSDVLAYRNTNSFNYLVDRTLYRPRELIQFCTEVRDAAVGRATGFPASYDDVSLAEIGYSEARTKDISAEYRFQYPGLDALFETFRGGLFNMERSDLEKHIIHVVVDEIVSLEKAPWLSRDEHFVIEVLWRVGFLRARTVGGFKGRSRRGSVYLGSHQVRSLNLRAVSHFHVHPMFRAYLGMKEKKG